MIRAILGLTRSSMRLIVVEGARRSPRVRTAIAQPLTQPEPTSDQLREFLAKAGAKPVVWTSVIPREHVITRLIKLPTEDPAERAQMVEVYGKAQLPYPKEQILADSMTVEQTGGYSTVLLIACLSDVIQRHLESLKSVGVTPRQITVSSCGLLGWYQVVGRSANAPEPVMVVDVDVDRTELAAIAQGRLLFSRSVNQGIRELQGGSGTQDALLQEIVLSLSSVKKELPATEIRSIVLTGVGPVDQFKTGCESRVGLPVHVVAAAGSIRLPDRGVTEQTSLAGVLGAALAEERSLVNLLPAEVAAAETHRKRLGELALAGTLILGIFLGWMSLGVVQLRRHAQFSSRMEEALGAIEPMAKELQEKDQQIQLIEQVIQNRTRTASTLSEVLQATPAGITLNGLTFEKSRRELTLRGKAPSTRQVLDYIQSLERASHLEEVRLKYSSRRTGPLGEQTDFELTARLQ